MGSCMFISPIFIKSSQKGVKTPLNNCWSSKPKKRHRCTLLNVDCNKGIGMRMPLLNHNECSQRRRRRRWTIWHDVRLSAPIITHTTFPIFSSSSPRYAPYSISNLLRQLPNYRFEWHRLKLKTLCLSKIQKHIYNSIVKISRSRCTKKLMVQNIVKTKISSFFGESQDLKHSKMFFRGSSGSGSTGVVTLYMTKLSREVRRNCGSGPSQRWSILFYFLFFYIFIVFM